MHRFSRLFKWLVEQIYLYVCQLFWRKEVPYIGLIGTVCCCVNTQSFDVIHWGFRLLRAGLECGSATAVESLLRGLKPGVPGGRLIGIIYGGARLWISLLWLSVSEGSSMAMSGSSVPELKDWSSSRRTVSSSMVSSVVSGSEPNCRCFLSGIHIKGSSRFLWRVLVLRDREFSSWTS